MRALLIALALSSAFSTATAAPAARKESMLYAHCSQPSGEFAGTLDGELLLHRAFLDDQKSEDENIRHAVVHQLRYLWGFYRNDAAAHRALQVVLSAEEPEITITARKQVPYGRELVIDWTHHDEPLRLDEAYQIRAAARGRVERDDPALRVSYTVRFKLAICGRGEAPGPSITVPLPPDPWLAYWHVPSTNHRKLRYFADTAITNPCADDDFADLPHPYYYWYDWLPDRHGPDADGKPFDCRAWLHTGVDFTPYRIALQPIAQPSLDFSQLRRELDRAGPLTATVLIGVLDHPVVDLQLAEWQTQLGDGHGTLSARAAAARRQWERTGPHERGTGMFLRTLDELRQVMTVDDHTSTVDDGYLRVEVRGRLRKSNRPLRIRAYLGLTDVFGPRPPQHWRILRRGLAEDHLVFYWGHSGIGENFRLAQIEQHLDLSPAQFAAEFQRSPVRLVAFISCYSYMYFGQDLLAAGAERLAGGAFVFTGMGPVKRDHGPLPLFDLVDQVLAPDNPTGHVTRLRYLADDEFWMVKQVTHEK